MEMSTNIEDELPTERRQSNHHHDVAASKLESEDEHQLNGVTSIKEELDNDGTNFESPAPKRRKLGDGGSQRVFSRAVSPPWKKVAVDGPTSFLEAGKRRSARTNLVPLELQPASGKRRTRAANHQAANSIKRKYGRADAVSKSSPLPSRITPKRPYKKSTNPGSKIHPQSTPRATTSLRQHRNAPASSPVKHRYSKRVSTGKRDRSSSPLPPAQTTPKRRVGRPPKFAKKEPEKRVTTSTRRKSESITSGLNDGEDEDESELTEDYSFDDSDMDLEVDPNITPQRLNLKVRLPELTPQHPLNIPIKKHYITFRDWIEQGDPFEGPSPRLSEVQVRREARSRLRILKASEPGGILSGVSSQDVPENEDEPSRQYFHHDHLVAHALDMQRRMEREKLRHMRWAKKISQAVIDYWKELQPKTEEDIRREKEDLAEATARALHRQCIADLSAKWDMLRAEVEKQRNLRYQQEKEIEEKEKLNKVLEQSTQLLDARMRRDSLDTAEQDSFDAASGTENAGEATDAAESESENESNMSSDDSEHDDSEADANIDQDLSPEELRRKYYSADEIAEQGNTDVTSSKEPSTPVANDQTANSALDSYEVQSNKDNLLTSKNGVAEEKAAKATEAQPLDNEDLLLEDSDESIDMDDDMGSTEDDSDSETEDGASDAASDDGPGLLGFFSKEQLQDVQTVSVNHLSEDGQDSASVQNKESTSTQAEQEDGPNEVSMVPDAAQVQTPEASNSEATSNVPNEPQQSPLKQTTTSAKHAEPRGGSESKLTHVAEIESVDQEIEMLETSLPATPVSSKPLKTAVPSLLRGTLREYQHYGLDWLAGLYNNHSNGILADEMGLGKTIQTIALLGHLAIEHEQWGPHLIVVPTSVMLNWEMEFKKFLPGFKVMTYYGTQEERKQKRRGWLDDDKWNVVITSYQLVLQDQISFKKRGWHYLVLDEAHNIKNFRSQRWQTLLGFRTAARLLLTGTPLQNNLNELWSLMFFLMPQDSTDSGIAGFADLASFTSWFKKPVDQIIEEGRDTITPEAQAILHRLHEVLRPFLLRRLKADVEKQMPAKYEHVINCKLSKRQRHLYDGFMSRTQTRETLASGNYLSIINCLMQLRKVCNHPDLFETRPIVTSFAMSRSAIADYEIKELLLRRRLLEHEDDQRVSLDVVDLLPGSNGPVSALDTIQPSRLGGIAKMRQILSHHSGRIRDLSYDGSSVKSTLGWLENQQRVDARNSLHHRVYLTSLRSQRRPLMSYSLVDKLCVDLRPSSVRPRPSKHTELLDWFSESSPAMNEMVMDLPNRYESLQPVIQRYSFVTPAVVAPEMASFALSPAGKATIRQLAATTSEDCFHESRMRLSIAFPDKRLLQYDCGKLQRLDGLLRTLQAGGHRALIFTQMTKVLDILEQFLNIHGYRYLRLDGSTKIEQRQILTDRFNNDPKILAFILSSRSGGLGINLTGADSVIFYDLDWNPAMDKQCQDRCHRIGQTRDVHIYRFVSEYTIEANILRKANQKRLLDDVIIQDGGFTTDFFHRDNVRDDFEDDDAREAAAEASAAMDKILGNDSGKDKLSTRVLEQAEDREDAQAAKMAEKEVYADDADFSERPVANIGALASKAASSSGALALGSGNAATPQLLNADDFDGIEYVKGEMQPRTEMALEIFVSKAAIGIDLHMVEHLEWELRDVPIGPPPGQEKKKKKVPEHKVVRKRM